MKLKRRASSLLILPVLSAAAAIAGYASPAYATCFTSCEGALHFTDCSVPAPETWPLGTEVSFTVTCEECCSAPGGPSSCQPVPVNEAGFGASTIEGEAVAGSFAATNILCDAKKLYTFDGALALGETYYIHNQPVGEPASVGIFFFKVVEPQMGAGGAGGAGGNGGAGGAMSGSGGSGGSGGEMTGSGGAGGAAPDADNDPEEDSSVEGCSCSLVEPGAGGAAWLAAASALIAVVLRRARRKHGTLG